MILEVKIGFEANCLFYLNSVKERGCLGPGTNEVEPDVPEAFVLVATDLQEEVEPLKLKVSRSVNCRSLELVLAKPGYQGTGIHKKLRNTKVQ